MVFTPADPIAARDQIMRVSKNSILACGALLRFSLAVERAAADSANNNLPRVAAEELPVLYELYRTTVSDYGRIYYLFTLVSPDMVMLCTDTKCPSMTDAVRFLAVQVVLRGYIAWRQATNQPPVRPNDVPHGLATEGFESLPGFDMAAIAATLPQIDPSTLLLAFKGLLDCRDLIILTVYCS